jgi:hypothetical protein
VDQDYSKAILGSLVAVDVPFLLLDPAQENSTAGHAKAGVSVLIGKIQHAGGDMAQ